MALDRDEERDVRAASSSRSSGRDHGRLAPDPHLRRGPTCAIWPTRCTKRFGVFTAVDDLSLTIPQGSFFALLGASGCGKTTTLRMVAGLEEPTAAGCCSATGTSTRLRPYKRPVNTVFQSYALFPHLNIFENVAFGLRRRGDPRRSTGRSSGCSRWCSSTGSARRRPAQLSGGQQQRVALARALINQPQVLLLDEPLGALDLKLRRQMQIELKRIQTEVGITFVHVTHDQEEAMTMADTVAVMNAGRIEQLGAPADIYEFPATAFVANFLGQSNLLAGEAAGSGRRRRRGRGARRALRGARRPLPGRPRVRSSSGYGPEKLHLVGVRRRGAGRSPARRRRGHRLLLRGREHPVPGARPAGAASCPSSPPTPGSPAPLRRRQRRCVAYWDPRHAFLLPRTPGEHDRDQRRCSTSRTGGRAS